MKSLSPVEDGGWKKIEIRFCSPHAASEERVLIRFTSPPHGLPARRWFFARRWFHSKSMTLPTLWRYAVLLAVILLGSAYRAEAQTVKFDFDTGTPALAVGQNVPFDQASGGVTAHFSAASGGFSVQNDLSTSLALSLFSGKYIYPNTTGSVLVIEFSQQLTNLAMNFATAEQTPIENPTPIRLVAYTNSTQTPAVGSTTATGAYGFGSLPMGNLTFSSATPFNLVTINIQPGGATGFLVDNITNQVTGGTHYTITTSASPPNGGSTSGDGAYLSGASVTVVATPNPGYAFVDWTENGTEVSTSATYDFSATTNQTLVANFVPTCKITTSALPADAGSTGGDGDYPEGSGINVLATPNPGFAFVDWTENGTPVSTSASYAFTVSSNRTLAANFATARAITTTSSSTNSGSASGDGTYPVGASVNVVATPNTGYAFLNWTEDGAPVSTSASYLFTASTNRTLVANFTPDKTSVTFDFDTGAPALTNSQSPPFDQTSGGLTAHFSSPADPAFSVASDSTTGWILSKFSGNYLSPLVAGSVLDIQFSQTLSNITLTFATFDFQDVVVPTPIQLTAYLNSTATPAVGTNTAPGTYSGNDSMPMGTLTFHSATPFDLVRLEMTPTPQGATEFMVDNINIQSAGGGGTSYTIATSASPSSGGSTSGGGTHNSSSNVTVVATANPGYAFVNWTENVAPVSSSASYTFTASADRALVANFVPLLNIALNALDTLVMSWPATATGYVPQQNAVVGTTNWVNTTNTVNVVDSQNQVTVSPLTGNRFYRLFHP